MAVLGGLKKESTPYLYPFGPANGSLDWFDFAPLGYEKTYSAEPFA